MNLKIKATVDGVTRDMDLIIDSMKQLNKTLRRFSKYLKFKAQERFAQGGPGWAPVKRETLARNLVKGAGVMETKLKRDLMRAQKKAKNQKTVERRLSVLSEFRRLEAGGRLDRSLLTPKQSGKLKERMDRNKATSTRILGGLARSISSDVKNGTLTVFSKAEWSGVHNDGGTGGHGAQIPKREFLALDEDDLVVFEKFLLEDLEEKLSG